MSEQDLHEFGTDQGVRLSMSKSIYISIYICIIYLSIYISIYQYINLTLYTTLIYDRKISVT